MLGTTVERSRMSTPPKPSVGNLSQSATSAQSSSGKNVIKSQSLFDRLVKFSHPRKPPPDRTQMLRFFSFPSHPSFGVKHFVCIDTNVLLNLCRYSSNIILRFFEELEQHHVFLSAYVAFEFFRGLEKGGNDGKNLVQKNLDSDIMTLKNKKKELEGLIFQHFPELDHNPLIIQLEELEKQFEKKLSLLSVQTELVKDWVRSNANSEFHTPEDEKTLIDLFHIRAQEKLPPGHMDLGKKLDSHFDFLIWVDCLKHSSTSDAPKADSSTSDGHPEASNDSDFVILLTNDQKELKDVASMEWMKWECFHHTSKSLHIYSIEKFLLYFVQGSSVETETSKAFFERVKDISTETQPDLIDRQETPGATRDVPYQRGIAAEYLRRWFMPSHYALMDPGDEGNEM